MNANPKIIYVSGAYSDKDLGWKLQNILMAWQVAQSIWEAGHIAICPHANTFLMGEDQGHAPDIDFVAGDLVIIERCCDALFMLYKWSDSIGAKKEHDYAVSKGIPVFCESIWDEMVAWMNGEDDV